MNFLITKNLGYSYTGRDSFSLSGININVPLKSIYGLLGKNGSGKSTILKLIGGHLQPSSGQIILDGNDITQKDGRNRKISTVFQTLALFPHLTVEGNLKFAIKHALKLGKLQVDERLNKMLELFQLEDLRKRKATQLSLGQQQRVAVARSVATGADILLLDEPTASLDYEMKDQLIDVIKTIRLQELVKAIIIVSHDRQFIIDTCDNIGLIENGKQVCEGSKIELMQNPTSELIAKALGVVY